jgi:glycosyltransferase involved in cell wall biosynthesis
MKLKKICFVSLNVYPVLTGHSRDFMGGAEFQQVIIGRHLHEKGFDVSYVSKIFGEHRENEAIGGIPVFKTFSEEEGIRFFRFFSPRLPRIWKALKAADADIYYQRGAAALTGIVSLFCRIHKKTFIFSGAHETNFIPEAINVPYLRDKILYKWGIRNARHIIVQSHNQRRLLRENFGLDASVAYNVYPPKKLVEKGKYVLWVANIKPMKRPLLILEIAKSCPELQFRMAGGMVRGHEALYETVKREAASIKNLHFLGFQPLRATEELFDSAALFVNTSELEGFPNTFLQAWSRGIPTASFFDADEIIRKNRLGAVLGRREEIAGILNGLSRIPVKERRRIQAYFNRTHLPDRYLDHLTGILETGSKPGRNRDSIRHEEFVPESGQEEPDHGGTHPYLRNKDSRENPDGEPNVQNQSRFHHVPGALRIDRSESDSGEPPGNLRTR